VSSGWRRLHAASVQGAPWAALAWCIGLLYVYLKHLQFLKTNSYLSISRMLGRPSRDPDFSWIERLSLFRQDITIELVLVPAAFALLAVLLRQKVRVWFLIPVGLLLILVFYVNFLALNNVGQLLNRENMFAAVRFAMEHPELAGEYVTTSSLIKIGLLMLAFVAAAVAIARAGSTYPNRRTNLGAVAVGAVMGLSVIAFLVGLSVTLPARAAYRSSAQGILVALFRSDGSVTRFRGANPNEIGRAFSDLTHTPVDASSSSQFYGRASRPNVVVFVLETGPAQAFDPLRDKEVAEPISELLSGSFFAESHYSTYPYTSQAVFSIFSGLYPVNIRKQLIANQSAQPFGWVEALRRVGYSTRTYAPFKDTFENDSRLFSLLGFERRFVPDVSDIEAAPDVRSRVAAYLESLPVSAGGAHGRDRARLQDVLNRDLVTLQRLKADIAGFVKNGQPFVVSYLPQVGHGPWLDIAGVKSVLLRGRNLIGLQLRWLRELVEELRAAGVLDNTLILVTGDHGIRTTAEDPGFVPTAISDYSFHVPFLLYAPMVLKAPMIVNEPTSHVDIAPTMLSLIGVKDYRWPLQGLPIWSGSVLATRSIYLFGGEYFGSDGMYSNGMFYSCNAFSEVCQKSASLPFAGQNPMTPVEAGLVLASISSIGAIQSRTAELLVEGRTYETKLPER
jgi:hypothetical protein